MHAVRRAGLKVERRFGRSASWKGDQKLKGGEAR